MDKSNQFKVLHEFVELARKELSPESWDYVMGAAETETTFERNRTALDSLAFRPRVLRNVEHVDTGGRLLGIDLRLPVILAPIGSLQDFIPEGGVAPTVAAADYGAIHMLSSVCAPGPEEVAAAADYPKIFQIYVRGDTAWVDALVQRAIASGYTAVCFTIDLDYYGRRERDLAKRYTATSRQTASGEEYQARFSWDDVARLRDTYDVPLILKGIAVPEDAVRAVEHGIEVVYVSNHGGRQLDYGVGAMDMLPDIVAGIAGRAEIVVDGGIMRGTDIVKAMALGADAVGIGRMQGLAGAAAGAAGITRMLEILEEEVRTCLGLLGVTSFAELDASYLEKAPPPGRTGLLSPFPLLDADAF